MTLASVSPYISANLTVCYGSRFTPFFGISGASVLLVGFLLHFTLLVVIRSALCVNQSGVFNGYDGLTKKVDLPVSGSPIMCEQLKF